MSHPPAFSQGAYPLALMQNQIEQLSRTQVLNSAAFTTNGVLKRRGFNQTVAHIVKKEMQKRHESPRSRRQLIQSLTQQNRRGVMAANLTGIPGYGGTMPPSTILNGTQPLTMFGTH